MLPSAALAQDYTSGTLAGTVTDDSGAPVSGAQVTVKSVNQGFTRTLGTDSQGRFSVPLIPLGPYQVTVSKSGFSAVTQTQTVRLGGESAYSISLSPAGSVSELVITAKANPQLDFAATTTGRTIDLEQVVKQMPLARNLTSVVLLTPGATRGSSSGSTLFASAPSLSGGSVAENAYYLNGLNITNFDNYIGSSPVPFDFYKTIEVKSGGYPAEFGRATGGVVNAITKSGTNEYKFGIHANYAPNSLEATSPDTFDTVNSLAKDDSEDISLEAGGPIIKDHLFIYGLADFRDQKAQYVSSSAGSYTIDQANDPFYGVKVDAVITDRQRLEGTWFDTSQTTKRDSYAYTGNPSDPIGAYQGTRMINSGGPSWVAKYTGTFTDWLTISAAYGDTKSDQSSLPADITDPLVTDYRTNPAGQRISAQPFGSITDQSMERKFYRADADLNFNLVGKHHVRFGYDNEQTTLHHIATLTGGGHTYEVRNCTATYGAGCTTARVSDITEVLGGDTKGTNAAYYLQDSWDLTSKLNLQLGVRNDSFKVNDLADTKYIDLKNNWAPRLGATYDVFGDGRDKVFANFGIYYIPPASNSSFRTNDYYFYSYYNLGPGGVDPVTGIPDLGQQLTHVTSPGMNTAAIISSCPVDGQKGSSAIGAAYTPGVPGCQVLGYGIPAPGANKVAVGLKPTSEEEIIVGYEHLFDNGWKASINGTYRKLQKVSEDIAVDEGILAYCAANGIPDCDQYWSTDNQYVIANPGGPVTLYPQGPGGATPPGLPGTTAITLTNAQIGNFPKPARLYEAITLAVSRPFDGKWSLDASYTYGVLKGNYEGTVNSDIGQVDAGTTIDFDHPGLADNSYGYLPNHRRDEIKINGSYQVFDNFLVGANATITSPKHFGCQGYHPTDPYAYGYGNLSWFCNALPTPRGDSFTTDWVKNLDLSFRYTVPQLGSFKYQGNLVLRADIFNVFNAKAVVDAWEFGEVSDVGDLDPNYGAPYSYQAPRFIRVGFDWTW